MGLSLCIQGTHINNSPLKKQLRFIPVYTGNTDSKYKSFSDNPVYPCVYREHILIMHFQQMRGGLSLCIQGTL